MMITNERANYIAYQWVDAWNKRDLDRVLQNYDNTICHTSPLVMLFCKGRNFTIRGKNKLRQYYAAGMKNFKNVHFEIEEILVGVDSISILYKTTKNKTALELMFINEKGKVYRSYAYCN